MDDTFIHGSAVIDQPCRIGAGTRIWHFCHVMPGARIGAGCVLGQNVFVGADVVIGDGCKIQNNVSIFTGVTLEERVFVGPSAVFTNVRTPRAEVKRNTPEDRDLTRIREGATIGANATVICGVTVGLYGFVGAGSVVTRAVLDHALTVGNPARQVGWACSCGIKLARRWEPLADTVGFGCPGCSRFFRLSDGILSPED